jgi:hypothetical protein
VYGTEKDGCRHHEGPAASSTQVGKSLSFYASSLESQRQLQVYVRESSSSGVRIEDYPNTVLPTVTAKQHSILSILG